MKRDTKDPSVERQELYSTTTDRLSSKTGAKAITTRDPAEICRWAARHRAEPATGEATASGPATTQVTDGGTGLRFNFPGFAPFRAITWAEWFEHFDQHGLAFVYEEDVADRAGTIRYRPIGRPVDPPICRSASNQSSRSCPRPAPRACHSA